MNTELLEKREPTIGDKKKGREIGKYPTATYMWAACEICGTERWVQYKRNGVVSFICQSCKNRRDNTGKFCEKGANWKGGETHNGKYKIRKLHPSDFFYPMTSSNGYVMVNRLVMAAHLGRCLQKEEIVHHKNGDKQDNRIENLELTSNGEHSLMHSKGYKDGYTRGYRDGGSKKISELIERLRKYENPI